MATKKPWAWLDTETTGFKPSGGARVLQVSVRVTDDSCRDVTRGGRFSYTSDVQLPVAALVAASPKALEVNHFARIVPIGELRALPEDERPRVACGKYATQFATDVVLADPEVRIRPNRDYKYADNLVPVMVDPAAYFAAPPPHIVWQTVHTMLSGCHLVCQNLPFDKPFVENELALCDLTYPCDFRGIEIMSFSNLVAQHLEHPTWGLDKLYDALAKRYGLEELGAHRADADVARMMAIYKFARAKFLTSFELFEKVQELNAEVLASQHDLEVAHARIRELEEAVAFHRAKTIEAARAEADLG